MNDLLSLLSLLQLLIFCTTFLFVWFLLYTIDYIMWEDWFEGRNSWWNILYKRR